MFEVESVVARCRTLTPLDNYDDRSRCHLWLYPTAVHVDFLSQPNFLSQFHFSIHYGGFIHAHFHIPAQLYFHLPNYWFTLNGYGQFHLYRSEDGLDGCRYQRVSAEPSAGRSDGFQHDFRRAEHERSLPAISLCSMSD